MFLMNEMTRAAVEELKARVQRQTHGEVVSLVVVGVVDHGGGKFATFSVHEVPKECDWATHDLMLLDQLLTWTRERENTRKGKGIVADEEPREPELP